MLTIKSAFVIWMAIGSVKLTPQYVRLPCPVVARRAKSEAEAGIQIAMFVAFKL